VSAAFDAAHLPANGGAATRIPVPGPPGAMASAPALTPADVDAVCVSLLAAASRLRELPVSRVVRAIDTAARALRDPGGPVRAGVLAGIEAFTGASPAMAAHVLDRASADWLAPALERLLHVELGGPAALEGFVDRHPASMSSAVAPALGFHVFAGNVPGVSVTSIIRALLVRSAVFGKSAAGEPVLAAVFARLLAEADPDVGACVAVTWWPGGETALEDAVLRHAGLVVHYGGGEAIASLRARVPPHVPFLEHGPRVSLAVVNAAAMTEEQLAVAAEDLARATAVFDQQGCVSPQAAWVLDTPARARAFAGRLAAALDRVEAELPRGRLQPEEAAAVRGLRTAVEFRGIAGEDVELWAGAGLAWTVVFDATGRSAASCLNRSIVVRSAPASDAVVDELQPLGRYLQTVGTAGFTEAERTALALRLAAIGVTRITPISAMPWPPPTWHHDGRGPLRELVRWVDLER
jgi:hypothetical protein